MKLKNVERYFNVLNASLFTTCGKLDYDRVTEGLIKLANCINECEDGIGDSWQLGEFGACTLDSLIVGAYWHYTEWHEGQWSKGYEALSALGQVFSPNMSTLDEESPEYYAYQALEEMAGVSSEIKSGLNRK